MAILWTAIISTATTATVGLIVGWWNRKRRSTVRAEDRKHEAEARNLEIKSIAELLEQLRETRAEVEAMARTDREKAVENRRQQGFLRDQVRWHEQLTILARQAAHAAINEIQRCVIAIHLRDDVIKAAGVETDLPAFEQKEHDEIVKYQEFPLPPTRLSE